jgi:hypothetical protein
MTTDDPTTREVTLAIDIRRRYAWRAALVAGAEMVAAPWY